MEERKKIKNFIKQMERKKNIKKIEKKKIKKVKKKKMKKIKKKI